MSSPTKSSANVPKTTSTASSARASGIKKTKVIPGSHIKNIAALLYSASKVTTTPAQSPTTSKAASVPPELAVRDNQTSVKAHKSNDGQVASAAASSDPVSASPGVAAAAKLATPTQERRDDFDIFPTGRDLTLEPEKQNSKAQKSHEVSVRRLQGADHKLNTPATNSKSRPAPSVPEKTARVTKDTTSQGRHLSAPDFEKRLSLEQMKNNAESTLKQRRASLRTAYNRIVDACDTTTAPEVLGPLQEVLGVLKTQLDALKDDTAKLRLFGAGFKVSQIEGIDAEAIVALASWGVAVKTKFERDSVDGLNVAPLDDTAPKVPADDDLFGDAKLEAAVVNKPAPMLAPANPNISTRPKSSAFVKPKPPRKDMGISRTPQLTQPGFEKATRTYIIKEEVPGLAEDTAKRVEKKQTGKKGNNVFSKGANPAPVSRMRKDKNGELQFRKPRSVAVGEKRKRSEVMDEPNKRAVVEGRNLALLRTRHVATLSDAMYIDALPAPLLYFAL